MSRMCREKGAVKHDDRLDCLAQGVKYYTDAMAIAAYETVKERKKEDWKDMMDMFLDDPQTATDCLVFGMNMEERQKVRQGKGKKSVHTWV